MQVVKRKIKPFEYTDKFEFRRKKINNIRYISYGLFLIVSIILIPVLCIISLIWDPNTTNKGLTSILKTIMLIELSGLSLIYLGYTIFYQSIRYDINKFLEERKIRKKLKQSDNYQPLSYAGKSLNNVIELSNGKLFRMYHFISIDKCNDQEIFIELPVGYKEDKSLMSEDLCMFKRLNEIELCNLLTHIQEYYVEKRFRENLYSSESIQKEKASISSKITFNELEALPTFKSLYKLKEITENEFNLYNSELKKQQLIMRGLLNE